MLQEPLQNNRVLDIKTNKSILDSFRTDTESAPPSGTSSPWNNQSASLRSDISQFSKEQDYIKNLALSMSL